MWDVWEGVSRNQREGAEEQREGRIVFGGTEKGNSPERTREWTQNGLTDKEKSSPAPSPPMAPHCPPESKLPTRPGGIQDALPPRALGSAEEASSLPLLRPIPLPSAECPNIAQLWKPLDVSTPVASDGAVLAGWWERHKQRKLSPSRVGRETRLRGRGWGGGGKGSFQFLSSPPVPTAQPWRYTILWSLQNALSIFKRAEVALKEGTRPHAQDDRGQGGWAKGREELQLCPAPGVGARGVEVEPQRVRNGTDPIRVVSGHHPSCPEGHGQKRDPPHSLEPGCPSASCPQPQRSLQAGKPEEMGQLRTDSQNRSGWTPWQPASRGI